MVVFSGLLGKITVSV